MTETQAKEHPILFSADMIRAILDGRKRQTRRVVKPQGKHQMDNPTCQGLVEYAPGKWGWHHHNPESNGKIKRKHFPKGLIEQASIKCPYGSPGDYLWVREAFRLYERFDDFSPSEYLNYLMEREPIVRRWEADKQVTYTTPHGTTTKSDTGRYRWGRLRPSIHMPRALCRLRLRVTDVRVERLQHIRTSGIQTEGVTISCVEATHPDHRAMIHAYRSAFADLWNEINADRGFPWEDNPWVFVVEFEVA